MLGEASEDGGNTWADLTHVMKAARSSDGPMVSFWKCSLRNAVNAVSVFERRVGPRIWHGSVESKWCPDKSCRSGKTVHEM